MSDEVYVYLIEAEGVGMFKIGVSKHHPKFRVVDLQTGSPVRLNLVTFVKADYGTERAMHELFAKCRSHGEWFRLHPDDARPEEFRKYCRQARAILAGRMALA